jgi:hypothetical protein
MIEMKSSTGFVAGGVFAEMKFSSVGNGAIENSRPGSPYPHKNTQYCNQHSKEK